MGFNTSYHSQLIIYGPVTALWGKRRALSSAPHDTYPSKFRRIRKGVSEVMLS